MQSDDPELKLVENRLVALVRCVLAKADVDTEFAKQLKELFLSDSVRLSLLSKTAKKGRRAIFDPVSFLDAKGIGALRQELSDKPTSELAEVARQHRVISLKSAKGMERDELIAKLVAHAERKLTQGGVFLKTERSKLDMPQSETPVNESPTSQ